MLRAWLEPPRQLLALFVAVIVVPAAALAWLASRTLEQDRALERQRIEDRLDRAAGTIAATLRKRLDDLDRDLSRGVANAPSPVPSGSILATFGPDSVRVHPPGRLLFYPSSPLGPGLTAGILGPAESLEYWERDLVRAADAFRRLADTADPAQRAHALAGLARCLRKSGHSEAALSAYNELSRIDVRMDGVPASLLARHAHTAMLVAMAHPEASAHARSLLADLDGGRWMIDRSWYALYREQTCAWLPAGNAPEADRSTLALSDAVAALNRARPWADPSSGRETTLWLHGQPILAVWHTDGARALVYLGNARTWLLESETVWNHLDVRVAAVDAAAHTVLNDPAALPRPLVSRQALETNLPWTLHVASADPEGDAAAMSTRRQLVAGMTVLVGVLVLGGAGIVGRTMSREMAVRRAQAEFVATVSHEFRSPLTSMSHLIEMLESGDVVAEERRKRYYSVLGRETRRLRRLVENLLDFRRMEVGDIQYRREPVPIEELVRGTADDFGTELDRRDRVNASYDLGDATVLGDREALARAVWNLLDNAAKYSPPASPILLQVAQDGPATAISITDQGDGIPDAELSDIFRPFFRGASAKASEVKGTGIGLATVSHIVRAHRGEIRVTSESGRGSRFTIVLPLETCGAVEAAPRCTTT